MSVSKSDIIAKYRVAKLMAAKFKKEEAELRVQIVDVFFPAAGEGTHNVEFKNVQLKATVKYNYKFDQADLESFEQLFSDEERECIKRKPELWLTQYRKLDEDHREQIDKCVIVTPGLPSIEIKDII